MLQHKGWRVVGWGVVRHDFFEPISYGFFFHLVCHVTQANGSELAKRLGCVNFWDYDDEGMVETLLQRCCCEGFLHY